MTPPAAIVLSARRPLVTLVTLLPMRLLLLLLRLLRMLRMLRMLRWMMIHLDLRRNRWRWAVVMARRWGVEVVSRRGYVVRVGVRVGVGVGMGVLQRQGMQWILGMYGTRPVERGIVPHVMQWGLWGRVVKPIAAGPRDCRRRLLQGGERESVLLRNSLWMRTGVPLLVTRGHRCHRRRRRWVRQCVVSIVVVVKHRYRSR